MNSWINGKIIIRICIEFFKRHECRNRDRYPCMEKVEKRIRYAAVRLHQEKDGLAAIVVFPDNLFPVVVPEKVVVFLFLNRNPEAASAKRSSGNEIPFSAQNTFFNKEPAIPQISVKHKNRVAVVPAACVVVSSHHA